jgi:NitT/TauT family transport system ATP-binding protein
MKRSNNVLEVNDLSKHFSTSLKRKQVFSEVLSNISFNLAQGEFICIIGPNGCGKSTLLQVIASIIEPSSGTVLSNCGLAKYGVDRMLMFQSPLFMPWLTVLQNLELPIRLRGDDVRKHRARIEELLIFVGLSGYANYRPFQLSGGMQQKLAWCCALILKPSLLLMDEPFSKLDLLTRESLNQEFEQIWLKEQLSVIMVTHNIQEALMLSDKIIVLSKRPACIIDCIRINLPRPRNNTIISSQEFREYENRIRKSLIN